MVQLSLLFADNVFWTFQTFPWYHRSTDSLHVASEIRKVCQNVAAIWGGISIHKSGIMERTKDKTSNYFLKNWWLFLHFLFFQLPFLRHFENRFRKHLKGNFSLIESKETLKCIGRICVCVFLHTLSRFLERFKSNLVYPRASRDGTRLR